MKKDDAIIQVKESDVKEILRDMGIKEEIAKEVIEKVINDKEESERRIFPNWRNFLKNYLSVLASSVERDTNQIILTQVNSLHRHKPGDTVKLYSEDGHTIQTRENNVSVVPFQEMMDVKGVDSQKLKDMVPEFELPKFILEGTVLYEVEDTKTFFKSYAVEIDLSQLNK